MKAGVLFPRHISFYAIKLNILKFLLYKELLYLMKAGVLSLRHIL